MLCLYNSVGFGIGKNGKEKKMGPYECDVADFKKYFKYRTREDHLITVLLQDTRRFWWNAATKEWRQGIPSYEEWKSVKEFFLRQ